MPKGSPRKPNGDVDIIAIHTRASAQNRPLNESEKAQIRAGMEYNKQRRAERRAMPAEAQRLARDLMKQRQLNTIMSGEQATLPVVQTTNRDILNEIGNIHKTSQEELVFGKD